jgi:hypothetical protein
MAQAAGKNEKSKADGATGQRPSFQMTFGAALVNEDCMANASR